LQIIHKCGDKNIQIEVLPESSNDRTYIITAEEAREYAESQYQIVEGSSYQFKIEKGYLFDVIPGIVSYSKFNKNEGRLTPNIYVGTLSISILDEQTLKEVNNFQLEVRSIKTSYREDYRSMLGDITEKCTDLLLQPNSPVSQFFTTDFTAEPKTLYQRFAFIKSILDTDEFNESVHKFLTSPTTKWIETEVQRDIRNIGKVQQKMLRQIATSTNRFTVPETSSLRYKFHSVPVKLNVFTKKETIDTPENRFIKYALSSFLFICSEIRSKATGKRLIKEAEIIEQRLEQFLEHSVFKEISYPKILPLNSPVLQRKEGYREIFRIWLMFDLAAKLIWRGGDDVYSAGKRDVAILYEYWLFFKLVDLMKLLFHIEPPTINNLIESTADGLALKLKQGKYLPINGVYRSDTRILNVQFSYNKTFIGEQQYPFAGSWTRNLRPDYTLSIWPYGINSNEAEEQELIVHIHFDAKYKIEDVLSVFKSTELDIEKEEESKGTYKRVDLLKMHTYRDAIRRTAGAYLLYPGSISKKMKGFHEVLPGVGAFCVQPSKVDTGLTQLQEFLLEVLNHFLNRTSQMEKIAVKSYEVHKNKMEELIEKLPESIGENREFIPDEVFVLIGFYKNQEHYSWIKRKNLYNLRTGTDLGSLRLTPKVLGATYLLLHTSGETKTGNLLKLSKNAPRIFSKSDLIKKGYPTMNSEDDLYVVYDIQGAPEEELFGREWDITKLEQFKKGHASGKPFAVSVAQLMKTVINKPKSV
jgi:predicted component of viral defense system (DUF524 family)